MRRHAVAPRAGSAVAIGLLALLCAGAGAASNTTDYTDTWWNPTESGWGMQVVQQADVLFATIYVYDAQTSPDWYSAALGQKADGTWKGDLYATRGPWFGGPFNPVAVTKRLVGELAVTFSASDRGTLVYSVDGVPVRKSVERITMRTVSLSGTYAFWMNATVGPCGGQPASSGVLAVAADVSHTGGAVNAELELVAADGTLDCSLVGNYVQSGRLARSDGTFSCPGGGYGTYSMADLETAPDHMCGDLVLRNHANGCTLSASFASMRF